MLIVFMFIIKIIETFITDIAIVVFSIAASIFTYFFLNYKTIIELIGFASVVIEV